MWIPRREKKAAAVSNNARVTRGRLSTMHATMHATIAKVRDDCDDALSTMALDALGRTDERVDERESCDAAACIFCGYAGWFARGWKNAWTRAGTEATRIDLSG